MFSELTHHSVFSLYPNRLAQHYHFTARGLCWLTTTIYFQECLTGCKLICKQTYLYIFSERQWLYPRRKRVPPRKSFAYWDNYYWHDFASGLLMHAVRNLQHTLQHNDFSGMLSVVFSSTNEGLQTNIHTWLTGDVPLRH